MIGFRRGERPFNFDSDFMELYLKHRPRIEEAYEVTNNDLINQILYQ